RATCVQTRQPPRPQGGDGRAVGRGQGGAARVHGVGAGERAVRGDDRGDGEGPRLGGGAGRAAGVRVGAHDGRGAGRGRRPDHGGGGAEGPRRRGPPVLRGPHAVPDAGDLPPRGDPAVPAAAAGVAPPAPDRAAAVQRQRGRGGGVGADRAAADGGRRGVHADHLGRVDPGDGRGGGRGRLPGLPRR